VHNNSAAEKMKNFNDLTMAWEDRPNALFVGFAPYDNPRYAVAVIVEHGNFGAQAAAPIARDLMTYAITNDPAGRDAPPGPNVSDATPPADATITGPATTTASVLNP
jgi:penicillin-binding protein 2